MENHGTAKDFARSMIITCLRQAFPKVEGITMDVMSRKLPDEYTPGSACSTSGSILCSQAGRSDIKFSAECVLDEGEGAWTTGTVTLTFLTPWWEPSWKFTCHFDGVNMEAKEIKVVRYALLRSEYLGHQMVLGFMQSTEVTVQEMIPTGGRTEEWFVKLEAPSEAALDIAIEMAVKRLWCEVIPLTERPEGLS